MGWAGGCGGRRRGGWAQQLGSSTCPGGHASLRPAAAVQWTLAQVRLPFGYPFTGKALLQVGWASGAGGARRQLVGSWHGAPSRRVCQLAATSCHMLHRPLSLPSLNLQLLVLEPPVAWQLLVESLVWCNAVVTDLLLTQALPQVWPCRQLHCSSAADSSLAAPACACALRGGAWGRGCACGRQGQLGADSRCCQQYMPSRSGTAGVWA